MLAEFLLAASCVVSQCDTIDFNRDGVYPDWKDSLDFIAVFTGQRCPTAACSSVDFNNDGVWPDEADLRAFLNVYAGGSCEGEVGWASFQTAGEARVVYVSSTLGNDAHDGLGPDRPVRTLRRAYDSIRPLPPTWRDTGSYPDQIRLRRGDTWLNESLAGEYGVWSKSGRSAEEPLVVWWYGSDPQPPRIIQPQGTLLNVQADGGVHNVWILGLDFVGQAPGTGTTSADTAIAFLGQCSNWLVEGVRIQNFRDGFVFSNPGDGTVQHDIVVRRCVITDCFPDPLDNGADSHGMYLSSTRNVTIEECTLDHNGWMEPMGGTTRNHNVYAQPNNEELLISNCIVARGSATGLQLRGNTQSAMGNVLIDNALGITTGHAQSFLCLGLWPQSAWRGTIAQNVIVGGRDIGPNWNDSALSERGFALALGYMQGGQLYGNVVKHLSGSQPRALWFEAGPALDMDAYGNEFYIRYRMVNGQKVYIERDVQCDAGTCISPVGSCNCQDSGAAALCPVACVGSCVGPFLTPGCDPANPLAACKLRSQWQSWEGRFIDVNADTQQPVYTVGAYARAIGVAAAGASEADAKQAYFAALRTQNRFHWDPMLTAAPLNEFLRRGY